MDERRIKLVILISRGKIVDQTADVFTAAVGLAIYSVSCPRTSFLLPQHRVCVLISVCAAFKQSPFFHDPINLLGCCAVYCAIPSSLSRLQLLTDFRKLGRVLSTYAVKRMLVNNYRHKFLLYQIMLGMYERGSS